MFLFQFKFGILGHQYALVVRSRSPCSTKKLDILIKELIGIHLLFSLTSCGH